jgi:hypothetical protein
MLKRLALAVTLAISAANAGTVFLGIGNNEFAGDIPVAAGAIQPYASTVTTLNNQDQGIITAINNASANNLGGFGSVDAFIFYYAGHGGTQGPNPDHIIGTSTDGGTTFPNNPATDDQLTAAIQTLNGAHPGVGVFIVLDTCFAGAAQGDLVATDSFLIGTADANNCAPGVSKFLPLWQQAFAINGGFFNADTNQDLHMTMQELFTFTNNIPNAGENPFGVTNGSFAGSVIVASVPEPGTWMLLVCGAGLLIYMGRRQNTFMRS